MITLHLFGTSSSMRGFLQIQSDLGAFSWSGLRFTKGDDVYMVRVIERLFDVDTLRGIKFDRIVIEKNVDLDLAQEFLCSLANDNIFELALGPCGK